jgi:hypothetical protein
MNIYRIKIIRHLAVLALILLTSTALGKNNPFDPKTCAEKMARLQSLTSEEEKRFELLLWQQRQLLPLITEGYSQSVKAMEELRAYQCNYYRWVLDLRSRMKKTNFAAANLSLEGWERGLEPDELIDERDVLSIRHRRDQELWFLFADAELYEIKVDKVALRLKPIPQIYADAMNQYEEFIKRESLPPLNVYRDLIKSLLEEF